MQRNITEPYDRCSAAAATLLGIAMLGILGAPAAILLQHPDLATRTGRHLLAGALGIIALVFVEVLICMFPLRRGEPWAIWAVAVPLFTFGLPIFVVDALFVPARTRVATLLPQGIGDACAAGLLAYVAWRRHRSTLAKIP
jgi:hypothetical protein